MSARNAAWPLPTWRAFVWVGVIASVLAWTWAWYVGHGLQIFMVVVALAGVVLAYRAVAGMRLAIVGLMVVGLAMLMASLYWLVGGALSALSVNAFDAASTTVLPMVTAVVLLLGAGTGFRHARD